MRKRKPDPVHLLHGYPAAQLFAELFSNCLLSFIEEKKTRSYTDKKDQEYDEKYFFRKFVHM